MKSGPQAGEKLAGPFHPLNINGEKACPYCSNGDKPVAMVFARSASKDVETLAKKLEAACAKTDELASFFVFCSDADGLEAKLKKVAKDAELKKVVLSIDNPAGPKGYKVSKDAEVTVVLYKNRKVVENKTFADGKISEKDIEAICEAAMKMAKWVGSCDHGRAGPPQGGPARSFARRVPVPRCRFGL
ncbi:MAG: hypothetical protein K2W96_13635 [Gemmataceae bacterium]|nr:hypothetical protein [Gemmataceae bacterium]